MTVPGPSLLAGRSQAVHEEVEAALQVVAIAERRVIETKDGIATVRYLPADQVRVGEQVHYTLRVRNAGGTALDRAIIDRALPLNTRYVVSSAVGPGADLSFSVDGGATFASAQELTLPTYVGPARRATVDDYTHIRWRLRHPLVPGATALLRFRAEFR